MSVVAWLLVYQKQSCVSSELVWSTYSCNVCIATCIGACGVLVPTGTVHSNSEFEFEVIRSRFNQ